MQWRCLSQSNSSQGESASAAQIKLVARGLGVFAVLADQVL